MTVSLKVLGWTLRASAAICIVYIIVNVAAGSSQYATMAQIAGSVGFHAAFALSGAQLVGCARRRDARRLEAVSAA
jgi:hypothetical protein